MAVKNNKSSHPLNVGEFDNWLESFYKECGREVTLAYTTLNTMQNWAIAIIAASIAATVAITKDMSGQTTTQTFMINVPIFIVAVITYAFNLRFFIRAILCYINLLRWNTLQSAVVEYKLLQRTPPNNQAQNTVEQLRVKLNDKIMNYYHLWLSPIDRPGQLYQNLKLGFYLILALPLLFVLIGVFTLWSNAVVRGLTFFAAGITLVEFMDFAISRYFDTPTSYERKKKRIRPPVFPIPTGPNIYFVLWIANFLISLVIVFWSNIQSFLVIAFQYLVRLRP